MAPCLDDDLRRPKHGADLVDNDLFDFSGRNAPYLGGASGSDVVGLLGAEQFTFALL
jgi:hypothetical protein